MKKYIVLLLLLHVQAGSIVFAQSSNVWVLTNPEPPFVVQDDKRHLSGYVVDVVKGILRQASIDQEILAAPWERVEKEARTKANVLVFALARTAEREPHYHWITPLTANVFALYALKSKQLVINDLSDFAQIASVSVLQNDARESLLERNGAKNIQATETWQQAVNKITNQEVDAIFFSDPGIQVYCANAVNNCGEIERVFMHQKIKSYLVMSKPGTDQDLVNNLFKAAQEYKSSDAFKTISNDWLAVYAQETQIPMHLDDGTLNLWKN